MDSKPTLLFVDDESTVLEVLSRMFERDFLVLQSDVAQKVARALQMELRLADGRLA